MHDHSATYMNQVKMANGRYQCIMRATAVKMIKTLNLK